MWPTQVKGEVYHHMWPTQVKGEVYHRMWPTQMKGEVYHRIWPTQVKGEVYHHMWPTQVKGVLLGVMTIIGIVENFSVFGMFFKFRKELNSRTTYMLMSLSISDGLMALIGGTMYTISSFNSKWPFKYEGCVFYGVMMFGTGCTDITHLMVIALDRMLAIASPIKYRAWAQKPILTFVGVAFSWLHGFFWAILPLTGMSAYGYEGEISCSIDWLRQDFGSRLYMMLIFIFSYFVPNLVMLFAYGFIFITVKAVGKKFAGDDSAASKKKRDIEVKLAINFSLVYVVYMMAWSPYAIVSFIGVFGNGAAIPMAARGLPAILAKFSFVVNPLLYVLSNKEHRKRMRSFLGLPDAVEPEEQEEKEQNKKKKATKKAKEKEDTSASTCD
ncbi:visual pigment-like receptor peropsin [Watersipora subatra]|uniref:visual pigment-like receptor peropsin n=1 Tax=Watersipora subatra TaxID=2589382 RepID=UPI00355C73D1